MSPKKTAPERLDSFFGFGSNTLKADTTSFEDLKQLVMPYLMRPIPDLFTPFLKEEI